MNIIDAIKSGKPFRHTTWVSPTYYLGPLDLADKMNLYQTTWQELISDDWQTKEPTVTITASQLAKLEKMAGAAKSLLSEDGAKEALAHYVVLQILADAVAALEAD